MRESLGLVSTPRRDHAGSRTHLLWAWMLRSAAMNEESRMRWNREFMSTRNAWAGDVVGLRTRFCKLMPIQRCAPWFDSCANVRR